MKTINNYRQSAEINEEQGLGKRDLIFDAVCLNINEDIKTTLASKDREKKSYYYEVQLEMQNPKTGADMPPVTARCFKKNFDHGVSVGVKYLCRMVFGRKADGTLASFIQMSHLTSSGLSDEDTNDFADFAEAGADL